MSGVGYRSGPIHKTIFIGFLTPEKCGCRYQNIYSTLIFGTVKWSFCKIAAIGAWTNLKNVNIA